MNAPSLHALLLTDVVDSTRLAEQLGDAAMAALWAAHDRCARDLLAECGGREIDKSDGMLLLFGSAAAALRYAVAYHRALGRLPTPLHARAGLHHGPLQLRENSPQDVARGAKPLEVDGLAKPIAARVMSLARGGQTLLTAQARQALGEPSLPLLSHGHWVLKGVSEPLELFEAGDDALRFAPPSDTDKAYRVVRAGERWLPAREIANNLPQQTTSFIGRETELAQLKAALVDKRMVTLLGMGGLGKTRLALQVAAEVMAGFPDGAWFVDLSAIRDPALVVSEAATVLGLREEPGRPLLHTLCSHLATRRALLVFDNCEHLVKPAAELVHAILRAAPDVHVLASSREALRVPGEQVLPVLPLPLPLRGASLATLSRSTAIQLFVQRAQAHKAGFVLDEREAAAVAELVTRLEGIPLALELAAARIRALPVSQINQRLADRYKLLTGGSRVAQERQQTLRALVDWSYELLRPPEQTLFQRLAVFAGGFDLPAAEAVCGAEPLDSSDVLDLLASLVEKSLVTMHESEEGQARYRMLDTLREYAHDKLRSDAAEHSAAAARHAEHFFVVAKQVRDGLGAADQAAAVKRGETELDNLRAAMVTARSGAVDALLAVKLCVAQQPFWMLRGYLTEGRAAVRQALALPIVQTTDVAHAHALYVAAVLATGQSDHAQARELLQACLQLRRRIGHPVAIAATLSMLAIAELQGGDARHAAVNETEALQIFVGLGDLRGQAICHEHLAQCALASGDDGLAAAHLEQGLALAVQTSYRECQATCQLLRAELAWEMADPVQARRWASDSLRVCRDSGDARGAASAAWWLARLDLAQGSSAANVGLADAIERFAGFEMHEQLLAAMEDAAQALAAHGQLPLAARLGGALAGQRERLNLQRTPRAEQRWQVRQKALREALGAPAWLVATREGSAWAVNDVVATAQQALRACDG